ncbi:MAG: C40 family peptidase [Clostridiales bacterium]|nr:C40 family peptidase [Clostridiales bacterium]
MFKRVLSLLLCLSLMGAMTLPVSASFQAISDWAVVDVEEAQILKLLPDSMNDADLTADITRAEMCQIAILAYEKIVGETVEPQDTTYFSDTDDPVICAAYELGIVSGYAGEYEGMFRPDAPLTRQEFSVILSNLNRSLGCAPNDPGTSLSSFYDAYLLASWAQEATKQMVLLGVVRGSTGNGKLWLAPEDTTTREEAIAMFMRCYKSLDEYYTMVVNNAAAAQVSELVGQLLTYAQSYLGTRYVYGGASPNGFDCSGFTQYCYRLIGVSINRTAQQQYSNGVAVSKDALQPGDLVFFYGTYASTDQITHVGIYLGDGTFIHAANSNSGVIVSSMTSGYYSSHYYGARHILG